MSEERSLWYVALTRAERYLSISYSTSALDGSPRTPSRFLSVNHREALATADPFRADLTYAGADRLPGMMPQEPVALPTRFSVTRLDDWFACQRKFYFSAVLGLSSESAFQLTFGSALHKTLERFHTDHRRIDATLDIRALIDDMRRLREAVWNERRAEFESEIEFNNSGASADRMLKAYVASLPKEASQRPFTVEEVERKVDVPLGEFTLGGKIDRIDRFDDGSTRIVDFKSSRMYGQFEKTATKLEEAVDEETLYVENRANNLPSVQLPLYRRALANSASTALVYLRGKEGEGACVDETPGNAAPLYESIDTAIERGFLERVRSGVARFNVTEHGRTCEFCNYSQICDGALEAVYEDA
jgi:DNA helicase-2/ATP-dependent DNA helicase PcrA